MNKRTTGSLGLIFSMLLISFGVGTFILSKSTGYGFLDIMTIGIMISAPVIVGIIVFQKSLKKI